MLENSHLILAVAVTSRGSSRHLEDLLQGCVRIVRKEGMKDRLKMEAIEMTFGR